MILLDRSDSMKEKTPAGTSLAGGAAEAVNRLLFNLAKRSQKEQRRAAAVLLRHRRVRLRARVRRSSARGWRSPSRAPSPAGRWWRSPISPPTRSGVDQVRTNVDLPPTRLPIWVDPVHGYGTPMCQALATAGYYAQSGSSSTATRSRRWC